jgi:hypothetical protein
MALRDRLIEIVGGKKYRQEQDATQEAFNRLYDAYLDGPFRMTPDMLREKLSDLIRSMQANSVTGLPYNATTEDQREYQLAESRYEWFYSPLAQWAIWTWTNNGLGEKVNVTCTDKKGKEWWDYTWDNSRIFDDDRIHENSNWVCVDGDVYFAAFHDITTGQTIYELLSTDEIKEICTNPDNKNEPLYYKREYTDLDNVTKCVYYPDYEAFFKHREHLEKYPLPEDAVTSISEKMDASTRGTCITILHSAHNRKDANSLHGWPILGIASPYFRAHKEFVENRLTVSRQKASFVRELTTSGGSRGVEAVRAKFGQQLSTPTGYSTVDANPPALAGSSLIHNKAVEHRDLPMTTGASDAKADNEMFAWQALIGAGLFPTTAGMDTSRWATALAMDKNQSVLWSRYQSFWACQFRKMVELVLMAAEKWGNAKFEDKGSQVSIDTLSLVDFPGVVAPIAQMLGTLPNSGLSTNAQLVIEQALWTPVLTALGTEDIDEILSDDMMGIVEPKDAKKLASAVAEYYRVLTNKKIAEKGN